MDTVLTGKSLYCARHGVELTCVADGARLDFMDIVDICSILIYFKIATIVLHIAV